MGRYLVTVCDEMGCEEVGRANTEEGAKRKATRAVRKRAKRWKGIPAPEGRIKASVYQIDRGIVREKEPVYEAEEKYGAPGRGAKRRRPAAEASEE